MQFTETQIKEQEDFVKVLNYNQEQCFNNMLERQRDYNEALDKYTKEDAFLKVMRERPCSN